ncbi:hypothetical protein TWF730_001883 [Orbilia blumenaviensis]|uniref:MARVEL domain-containing protein n=1 Tax=Orbilia blumenaviensis TaxID=1796055 RepID=A0AAV9UDB3_9PEZI
MAERSGTLKSGLWAIRFFQFIFAVVLVGILSWFHHRLSKAGYFRFDSVDVPLGFSVAALVISAVATATHLFFHDDSQTLIALFDFLIFVGYFASCIVYRHNFNANCGENLLVRVFRTIGSQHCNMVRLAAALLVLQTILFFLSTILSHRLSRRRQAIDSTAGVHEEKSRFGFGRRSRRQPEVAAAV